MHRARTLAVLLFAVALLAAPAAHSSSPDMVVSQVFAGGGNSGASFTNDFVELFNRGSTAIDVSSWSIQYASAAGTTWQATPLAGSVQPGRYYLVQLASGGTAGAALPSPDATGTSNLAVSGGKIALVRGTAPLTCGAAAGSCSANSFVADLIGYGAATDFEGNAGALSSTTSALRAAGGCTDTDVNADDFAAGSPPIPRNSAAAAGSCAGGPPPTESASAGAGVDIDIQGSLSIALERQSISFGNASSGDNPAAVSERVTVRSSNAAGYALTVHRSAFAPADLPLGLKATAPSGSQLGAGLAGGAMAAIPIVPAPDLLVGTTAAASAASGDAWQTNVGFVAPLPVAPPGRYTATITFTVIGR